MSEQDYRVPPWSLREAFVQRHGCTPEQYKALMEWVRTWSPNDRHQRDNSGCAGYRGAWVARRRRAA